MSCLALFISLSFGDNYHAGSALGQLRLLPTLIKPSAPKPKLSPKVERYNKELGELVEKFIVEIEREIQNLKKNNADVKTIREFEELLERYKEHRRVLNGKL